MYQHCECDEHANSLTLNFHHILTARLALESLTQRLCVFNVLKNILRISKVTMANTSASQQAFRLDVTKYGIRACTVAHILTYTRLFNNTKLSDVTVFCRARNWSAHKAILAGGSAYFAAAFHSQMKVCSYECWNRHIEMANSLSGVDRRLY